MKAIHNRRGMSVLSKPVVANLLKVKNESNSQLIVVSYLLIKKLWQIY